MSLTTSSLIMQGDGQRKGSGQKPTSPRWGERMMRTNVPTSPSTVPPQVLPRVLQRVPRSLPNLLITHEGDLIDKPKSDHGGEWGMGRGGASCWAADKSPLTTARGEERGWDTHQVLTCELPELRTDCARHALAGATSMDGRQQQGA